MASKTFREVEAWKRAHEFVLAFYKTKQMFPDELSKADKLRFFNIAQGSLEECRYYIILCHDVGYYSDETSNDMWETIEKASAFLNAYSKAVKEDISLTSE